MSTTKHREVAKLDRVPLPVEAARIGATGWQMTRTGARVVTKLAGNGSLQQKIIKQIPQTFADLGPTYVKFGQIIASSPGAFGEQTEPRVPQPARRGAARRHRRSPQAVQGGTRRRPRQAVQDLRRQAVRIGVDRAGALRDAAQRRGGRGQDPAAGHPPARRGRPADPQARRADSSSWPSSAGGCPPRTSSPTSPTTSPRNSTSGSKRSRWTRGWRTCTPRRSARTSGCRRCTGI